MTYYRRNYRNSAPLTPPAELVGHLVKWRPKNPDGSRGAACYGTCTGYDAESQTLTVEVRQDVSPWQPNPTRVVTIALRSGPFTIV